MLAHFPLSSGWWVPRVFLQCLSILRKQKSGAHPPGAGLQASLVLVPTALKLRGGTIPCSGTGLRRALCDPRSAEAKSHLRGRRRKRSSHFHPRRRAIFYRKISDLSKCPFGPVGHCRVAEAGYGVLQRCRHVKCSHIASRGRYEAPGRRWAGMAPPCPPSSCGSARRGSRRRAPCPASPALRCNGQGQTFRASSVADHVFDRRSISSRPTGECLEHLRRESMKTHTRSASTITRNPAE